MHTYLGLTQLIAAEPDAHRTMMNLLDENRDWTVDFDELATNSLIVSLLAPDVTLGGRELLSFGFHVHAIECEAGTCATAPPDDTCKDRVLGTCESDVDCGGACRSCKAGEACNSPADCESGACDAGRCRAPSCNDGVRDGWETDVDCGGDCGGCAVGARCFNDTDCAAGTCGVPCSGLGCGWSTFDPCRAPS